MKRPWTEKKKKKKKKKTAKTHPLRAAATQGDAPFSDLRQISMGKPRQVLCGKQKRREKNGMVHLVFAFLKGFREVKNLSLFFWKGKNMQRFFFGWRKFRSKTKGFEWNTLKHNYFIYCCPKGTLPRKKNPDNSQEVRVEKP